MSDDKPHDETQPVRPAGAEPPPATPPTPTPTATPTAPPTTPPTTPPTPAATEPPAAAYAAQRRGFRERLRTWRGSRDGDRTYGLAALIASALAGLIVGGLGWAAVSAAVDDDHGPDRDGWVQRDDDRGPGDRGGMPGGPRGVPGQLPPTTAPEDESGSAS